MELISIVPVFFPIIRIFAATALLVAGILTLIGLYQCRKDDSGCRTAFTLVIVQLVTNLLSRFIPGIIDTIFCWQPMLRDRHRCTLYAPPFGY